MKHPEIKTYVQKTIEEITTEVMTLAPNVEVRRTTTVRTGPNGGNKTTHVGESVVFTKKTKDPYFGFFHVVSPDLPEKVRMKGWISGFGSEDDDFGTIYDNPFSHVLSGDPYEVVRLRYYDHTLFDVEGQPLPVGMHFGYGVWEGEVNDHAFDLDKLMRHLKGCEDVTLLEARCPHPDNPYRQSVPGYNLHSTSGNYYMSFIWHPDVETFREYEGMLGDHNKVNSWDRYNLAHTFMGNDVFRVNKDPQVTEDED